MRSTRHLRTIRFLLTAFLLTSFSAKVSGQESGSHGTLVSAFGNSQGIVVVTDSMGTSKGRNGIAVHRFPFRKLLKFDDHTVCAIAGLGTTVVPSAPDLNADVMGIVSEYSEQVKAKGIQQPLSVSLAGISALLRFYLEGVAEVNAETGHEDQVDSYYLELLLAGYDLDRKGRIGELVISVKAVAGPEGRRRWHAQELQNDFLEIDGGLKHSIKGIDDVANRALSDPSSVQGYRIFQTYATAKKTDAGSTLTVEQLEELQRALSNLTSDIHREVGGPKQVAILEPNKTVRVEQPDFPAPQKPFSLIIYKNSSLMGAGPHIGMTKSVKFYASTRLSDRPYDPVTSNRLPDFLTLDGGVFVNCIFENENLWYNGGPLYIDKSTKNINSHVAFGLDAAKRPDMSKLLTDIFSVSDSRPSGL